MKKQGEKICGKCGASFLCKADNIENCACNKVQLSKETTEFLSKTNFDCLCINCLIHYNNLVEKTKKYPISNNRLIKDIHFYIESDNLVFTELYHITKGYCCKNGCRHCAYGYKQG